MDTSKEYIEMCRKAVEIQELRKYAFVFDDTWYSLVTESRHICDLSSKKKGRHSFWLPRQDQLQDIISKYNEYDCEHWYETFQDFLRFYGNENIDNINSMEQLWLAFVMHEKYGKKWDGKDWVKE